MGELLTAGGFSLVAFLCLPVFKWLAMDNRQRAAYDVWRKKWGPMAILVLMIASIVAIEAYFRFVPTSSHMPVSVSSSQR